MKLSLGSWEITTKLTAQVEADVIRVQQVHGNTIVWAHEVDTASTVADGLAAHHSFTSAFMINTADCLPLVVVSGGVACAVHVSRKTLLKGLLDRVPDFIQPETIRGAWIGPHVCSDHFVFDWVGEDIAAFQRRFPEACVEKEDGLHISTLMAVKGYLRQWGVRENVLRQDGGCTFEQEIWPSYRRSLRNQQKLKGGVATVVKAI